MTRQQELDVLMQGGMAVFFEKQKDRFVDYSRLQSEINTFGGYQTFLLPMIAKQSEVITGITANKVYAINDIGNQLIKIGRKALVFAKDINDLELVAKFTVTVSSFKNQSQTKKLSQAQGFLDALEANAVALAGYNVGADVIKGLSDSIINCNRQILDPTTDSSGKTAATKGVKKFIKASNDSLALIDEMVTGEYGDTDPDFVTEYFIRRQVNEKGVRHTGINVTFTDAATGTVIEGATISIALLNKTAVSNINGVATIPKMKTGTYHIDFSANGYTAQMQDVIVPRSRKVDIAMVMVAVETV